MKTLMKPIEMIHCNYKDGRAPMPIRFLTEGKNGEKITVSIDRVNSVIQEKLAGNPMYLYECEGLISGKPRNFEIKMEINSRKWFLFRI